MNSSRTCPTMRLLSYHQSNSCIAPYMMRASPRPITIMRDRYGVHFDVKIWEIIVTSTKKSMWSCWQMSLKISENYVWAPTNSIPPGTTQLQAWHGMACLSRQESRWNCLQTKLNIFFAKKGSEEAMFVQASVMRKPITESSQILIQTSTKTICCTLMQTICMVIP